MTEHQREQIISEAVESGLDPAQAPGMFDAYLAASRASDAKRKMYQAIDAIVAEEKANG